MRSADGAIAWMADQNARNTTGWRGWCLRASRTAWGLPGGWDSANAWWAAVPAAHKHPWSDTPPLGAPVYFAGGNFGHIGLSDGRGGLWHTDAPNADRIGHTPIHWPRDRWGFRSVGWASWLNGSVLPVGSVPVPPNDPTPPGDDETMEYAELRTTADGMPNDPNWRYLQLPNVDRQTRRISNGGSTLFLARHRFMITLTTSNTAPADLDAVVAFMDGERETSTLGTVQARHPLGGIVLAGSCPDNRSVRIRVRASAATLVRARAHVAAWPW
jgi:hypothetical protein